MRRAARREAGADLTPCPEVGLLQATVLELRERETGSACSFEAASAALL